MRRAMIVGCCGLLGATACGNPTETTPAPGAPASQAAPAAKVGGDAQAARALFDEAVRVHLAGDEIGYQDRLLRLATEHPDTPHGRAALRRVGGTGQWLPVTGVLAAVAIPAFMKYIRRSKTSEATMHVRKMFDASVSFYHDARVGPDGALLPRRFPQSTGMAPARPHCADGEKFQPQPSDWNHPGWQELNFAIEDPHYFRYEYVSSGEGATAAFTARAIGDLDCDGVYSTFERVGYIDATGNVTGGAGLFMLDELE